MRPHRITVASAAEVAAKLPFPSRREGPGRYRTRGACHGNANDPDSDSLVYKDPRRPGEQSLVVYCHNCRPEPKSKEMDEIRHVLQELTGLQLCLCLDCCAAARDDQPPPRRSAAVAGVPRRAGCQQERPDSRPEHNWQGGAPAHDRGEAKQWGAHLLPEDDSGGRSHTGPCPLCQQPNALIAWVLADHPFPYVGLSLQCSCANTATYDQLHKHIASQIAAKGKVWRQDAVYTLADENTRARKRIDPGKDLRWSGSRNGPDVKGRQPLYWNRRGQPPDYPHALLVEGEKAAAALISAGIDGSYAIYSVGDTGGFYVNDFALLAGRSVVIWPDADHTSQAGIDAAARAARRLAPIVSSLYLIATDDLPDKADAADFTKQEVLVRIRQAQEI